MRFNMKTGEASQKKLSASAVDFPRVNESYTGRLAYSLHVEKLIVGNFIVTLFFIMCLFENEYYSSTICACFKRKLIKFMHGYHIITCIFTIFISSGNNNMYTEPH